MEYFLACLVMGTGISIDVVIATLGRFRQYSDVKSGQEWIAWITVTHIVFPMSGYYLFVFLHENLPAVRIGLGLVAFVCVCVFLISTFRQWLVNKSTHTTITGWMAILAVSWDALWSGPAKSAQAIGWNYWEILASFFLVGVFVSISGYLSLHMAIVINRQWKVQQLKVEKLASREVIACWIEFSVIGYFGVLAFLRYVIDVDYPWPTVLVVTALLATIPFIVFWNRLLIAKRNTFLD